jgi:hypothetical protein
MQTTSWNIPLRYRAMLLAIPLALAAGLSVPAGEAKLPSLEQGLKESAPRVLAYLRDGTKHKPYHNVGVLKFLVQTGKAAPGDNVGPLNLRLASRLEVALVLALPKDESQLRILHDASGAVVRARNRRANHLDRAGRLAFFDTTYEPAWGTEEALPADALLTGLARFDGERRALTVTVQAFDRTGELKEVCSFRADATPRILTEAGISYVASRGAIPREATRVKAKPAVEPKPPSRSKMAAFHLVKARPAPEVRKEAPVAIEILYDGKPVRARKGIVPEPKEGQNVSFRLRHRNLDKITYGVVLKVNGRNTIFPGEEGEQETEDLNCYKWIVKRGATVDVPGFQSSYVATKEFHVDPALESDRSTVHYNRHAGTFQLVIFRARQKGEEKVKKPAPSQEEAAIARGSLGSKTRAATLVSLQGRLGKSKSAASAEARGRGIIRDGPTRAHRVKPVEFRAFPEPACSLTIQYYNPNKDE